MRCWRHIQSRNPFGAVHSSQASWGKKFWSRFYQPLSPFFYPFAGINRAYRNFLNTEDRGLLFERVLRSLDISYEIKRGSLESIPREGSLVVIANHPTGGIDGVLVAALLEKCGRDFRIIVMAETGLEKVPEIAPRILPVDLRENQESPSRNLKALKDALSYLQKGGALIIFPSGGLPRRNLETGRVEESPWKLNVIKFLKKTQAPLLPIYLPLQSSAFYQWMGERHECFRVGLLGEQITRLRGQCLPVLVGELFSASSDKDEDLEKLRQKLWESVFSLRNGSSDSF